MDRPRRENKGSPVTIRGVTYKSGAAAARALGVTASTVYRALDRGTIDNVGVGSNALRKIPHIYKGVEYGSLADLASHLGIDPTSLSNRLISSRKSNKNYLYLGEPIYRKGDLNE